MHKLLPQNKKLLACVVISIKIFLKYSENKRQTFICDWINANNKWIDAKKNLARIDVHRDLGIKFGLSFIDIFFQNKYN